ncbi:hypothetical protein M8C21_030738 [Ambrosia artemisiifolia]|uniref:Uncharacterized protein n=1 Tax=Ambrosia artemisiifolia TaxID=4212 RepID=A0AAD5CUA1_AMBAR|nr:hypothetical protein M8C21_030738 [Ambrosia artemisiifolia]
MSTREQVRRNAGNGRRRGRVLDLSVPPVENLEQAAGSVPSVDQGGQEEVGIRLDLNRANKRRRGHPNPPTINRGLSVNSDGSSGSMRKRAWYIFEYLKSKFLNLATHSMQLHSLERERAQYIAPLPPPTQERTSNDIATGLIHNQVNKRRRGHSSPPSRNCELYSNLEESSSSMV